MSEYIKKHGWCVHMIDIFFLMFQLKFCHHNLIFY